MKEPIDQSKQALSIQHPIKPAWLSLLFTPGGDDRWGVPRERPLDK